MLISKKNTEKMEPDNELIKLAESTDAMALDGKSHMAEQSKDDKDETSAANKKSSLAAFENVDARHMHVSSDRGSHKAHEEKKKKKNEEPTDEVVVPSSSAGENIDHVIGKAQHELVDMLSGASSSRAGAQRMPPAGHRNSSSSQRVIHGAGAPFGIITSGTGSAQLPSKRAHEEKKKKYDNAATLVNVGGDEQASSSSSRNKRAKRHEVPLMDRIPVPALGRSADSLYTRLAENQPKIEQLESALRENLKEKWSIEGPIANEASRLCAEKFAQLYPDVLRDLKIEKK